MRRTRIPIGCLLVAPGLVLATNAMATTYTDALADNYGGPEVDISSVVVTNDATNINFLINLNSGASIGPSANHYADYEIGIQEGGGAGGQTAINGTYGTGNPAAGNPYGNAVGISTGENYFIGSFLAGSTYSGGAQLYGYSSVAGWNQIGSNATLTQVNSGSPSLSFSLPLSALGLSVGQSFNFDAWTSFGSPQAAYDALDNNGTGSANAPYNSGTTYDSATAPGSVLAIYTVAAPVPEPTSMAILGGAGLLMMRRRRA
ncbi:MAG TPA: PEP-CTERM sorting domain-containing protein [Tepidisphaeraceae bacterium]